MEFKEALAWLCLCFVVAGFVQDLNAAYWVSNPVNCPSVYLSQSCGVLDVCGVTSGGNAQCYNTALINAPVGTASSQTLYSGAFNGGYLLDCHSYFAAGGAPFCTGNPVNTDFCNVNATCSATHNQTTCLANLWAGAGSSECNNNCYSGYVQCFVDDECDIQVGSACTVGGLPGTWDALCNCVLTTQHHLTQTEAKGSGANANLWSTNFGNGLLFNLTSAYHNASLIVNGTGCLIFNDSSYLCNASASGGVGVEVDPVFSSNLSNGVTWNWIPFTDNTYYLGNNTNTWHEVHAYQGTFAQVGSPYWFYAFGMQAMAGSWMFLHAAENMTLDAPLVEVSNNASVAHNLTVGNCITLAGTKICNWTQAGNASNVWVGEVFNGTFNETDGVWLYNSTPFMVNLNITAVNDSLYVEWQNVSYDSDEQYINENASHSFNLNITALNETLYVQWINATGVGEIYNGTFNETEQYYVYNDTPFTVKFNETLLNSTIDYRLPSPAPTPPWDNDSAYLFPRTNYPQNVNFTGNLTLGDQIWFGLGQLIDGLTDGWITIYSSEGLLVTRDLNVSGNVTASDSVNVTNCIELNGTSICNWTQAGNASATWAGETHNGTFNETDGVWLYNSTPFMVNANITALNDSLYVEWQNVSYDSDEQYINENASHSFNLNITAVNDSLYVQWINATGVGEIYNGTFNETEGTYVYNSTNWKIDFNETALNSTILSNLAGYAKYSFGYNNFTGNGNFTTVGGFINSSEYCFNSGGCFNASAIGNAEIDPQFTSNATTGYNASTNWSPVTMYGANLGVGTRYWNYAYVYYILADIIAVTGNINALTLNASDSSNATQFCFQDGSCITNWTAAGNATIETDPYWGANLSGGVPDGSSFRPVDPMMHAPWSDLGNYSLGMGQDNRWRDVYVWRNLTNGVSASCSVADACTIGATGDYSPWFESDDMVQLKNASKGVNASWVNATDNVTTLNYRFHDGSSFNASNFSKIMVTSTDSLAQYLDDKIMAGIGLTKSVGGIPEVLTLSAAPIVSESIWLNNSNEVYVNASYPQNVNLSSSGNLTITRGGGMTASYFTFSPSQLTTTGVYLLPNIPVAVAGSAKPFYLATRPPMAVTDPWNMTWEKYTELETSWNANHSIMVNNWCPAGQHAVGYDDSLATGWNCTSDSEPSWNGNLTQGVSYNDWVPNAFWTLSLGNSTNAWNGVYLQDNITDIISGASCSVADACTIGSGATDYSPWTNDSNNIYPKDANLGVNVSTNLTVGNSTVNTTITNNSLTVNDAVYSPFIYGRDSLAPTSRLRLYSSVDGDENDSEISLYNIGITSPYGVIISGGNESSGWNSNGDILLETGHAVDSNITFSTHRIMPYADDFTDVGSALYRFTNGYFSDNVIVGNSFLNGTTLNTSFLIDAVTAASCSVEDACTLPATPEYNQWTNNTVNISQKNTALNVNVSQNLSVGNNVLVGNSVLFNGFNIKNSTNGLNSQLNFTTTDGNAFIFGELNSPWMRLDSDAGTGGWLCVGTNCSASSLAHLHSTGPNLQLRLDYDSTHYTSFDTDSSGNLTITPSLSNGSVNIGIGKQLNIYGGSAPVYYNNYFKGSPSQTSSAAYTLPNSTGTFNHVLTTDGSGALSWSAKTGGTSALANNGNLLFYNTSGSVGNNNMNYTPANATTTFANATLSGTLSVLNGTAYFSSSSWVQPPANGEGLYAYYDRASAYGGIYAYNYAAATHKPLYLQGSIIKLLLKSTSANGLQVLNPSNAVVFDVDGGYNRTGINTITPNAALDINGTTRSGADTALIALGSNTSQTAIFKSVNNQLWIFNYLDGNIYYEGANAAGNGVASALYFAGYNLNNIPIYFIGPYAQAVTGRNLIIAATGQIGTASSSERYKTNVTTETCNASNDPIMSLRPVSFKYNASMVAGANDNATHYGFIAEEVNNTLPNIVYHDENGTIEGIDYDQLLAPMVAKIQAQQKQIDGLTERLNALEAKVK